MRNKPADVPYCGVRKSYLPMAMPKLNHQNLLYLYNFIKRRYIVHLRKDVLNLSPPWTFDEVLQQFRFTNIRREHDRETKWLIKNITDNPKLCYEDKLLNCVLFRLYNKHETAELISMPIEFYGEYKGHWDPEWYRSLFEAALVEDPNIVFFTAAFHTVGMKLTLQKVTGEDYAPMRILKFMKLLLDDGFTSKLKKCKTQEEAFKVITSYNGIGSFLGYQMFVDMTYVKEFPFSENEFTVAGPGCIMGLNYLFESRDGMTYEECLFWLRDHLDELFREELGKDWDPKKVFWDLPEEDRCFNVMSLENCFCELSKYIRAKSGTGRPRKRYKPHKEGQYENFKHN